MSNVKSGRFSLAGKDARFSFSLEKPCEEKVCEPYSVSRKSS